MNDLFEYSGELEQAILSTNQVKAEQLLLQLNEVSTQDFVEQVMVPAMQRIGNGWENGTVAISQVYMGAKICEKLIAKSSDPSGEFRQPQLHFAIAVLEDFHLLGKSIVYSAIRGIGYRIDDYGRVTVEQLVEKVAADSVDIILVSTLMLRSALRVKELRKSFDARGLQTKIIVGGAPFRFDQELWKEVGADATAVGTSELLPIIERLSGERDND